jgi:hypothetical protein
MNLVPGFIWHPVDVGARARRVKGRGHVAHVAVSGSTLLVPPPLSTRSADWHFYLPKVGTGVQMIDLDLQSWSSYQGNTDTTASEAQGGLGTAADVNAEPWSDDQAESLAQILAHLHRTEGVPIQVMPDSRPGSRGLGYHREGIDPWRVAGGQLWSTHPGKLCPGDRKAAMIPAIVTRAAQLVAQPTPTPEDNMVPLDLLNAPISWQPPGATKPSTFSLATWLVWTNFYSASTDAKCDQLLAALKASPSMTAGEAEKIVKEVRENPDLFAKMMEHPHAPTIGDVDDRNHLRQ